MLIVRDAIWVGVMHSKGSYAAELLTQKEFSVDKLRRHMNDGNILKRYIAPAARRLGLKVNWRSLRTSCATWMVQAGADPKSVQGQMRHSRISTTMDIYVQFVPEGQKQCGPTWSGLFRLYRSCSNKQGSN